MRQEGSVVKLAGKEVKVPLNFLPIHSDQNIRPRVELIGPHDQAGNLLQDKACQAIPFFRLIANLSNTSASISCERAALEMLLTNCLS